MGEEDNDGIIVIPTEKEDYHKELDDDDIDWFNYLDSRSEPIKYEIENIQKEEQKSEEHEIVKSFFVKLSDYL